MKCQLSLLCRILKELAMKSGVNALFYHLMNRYNLGTSNIYKSKGEKNDSLRGDICYANNYGNAHAFIFTKDYTIKKTDR